MAVVMHLYNETGSTTLSAAVTLISVISRMISGMLLPAISDRLKLLNLLLFSQLSVAIFIAIYIVVWVCYYLYFKKLANQMNEELKKI
ncbi:DUF3021 family protein [Parageobacillus thermoglucosidasius]|nr:DUF3021 family protein [Parageobacillus thermoglucosidasius]